MKYLHLFNSEEEFKENWRKHPTPKKKYSVIKYVISDNATYANIVLDDSDWSVISIQTGTTQDYGGEWVLDRCEMRDTGQEVDDLVNVYKNGSDELFCFSNEMPHPNDNEDWFLTATLFSSMSISGGQIVLHAVKISSRGLDRLTVPDEITIDKELIYETDSESGNITGITTAHTIDGTYTFTNVLRYGMAEYGDSGTGVLIGVHLDNTVFPGLVPFKSQTNEIWGFANISEYVIYPDDLGKYEEPWTSLTKNAATPEYVIGADGKRYDFVGYGEACDIS